MYIKYGDFTFNSWECSFSGIQVSSNYTVENILKSRTVIFHAEGDLCNAAGQDEYDLTVRLEQMITALSQEDKDIGLYHSDGTPTVHYIKTDHPLNMTGNKVLYQRWPEVQGGEYVTGRRFSFAVSCEVFDAPYNLIDFRDNISIFGNAGPEFRWERHYKWGWYPIRIAPSTIQRIDHFGYALGLLYRELPITPFYDPPFEQNHLRRVTWRGARRYAKAVIEPRTEWHYTYLLPFPDDFIRPIEK